MSSLGQKLQAQLIEVFDKLVENRCCEHGIKNSAKANEEAMKQMQKIINQQRLDAANAARFLS